MAQSSKPLCNLCVLYASVVDCFLPYASREEASDSLDDVSLLLFT